MIIFNFELEEKLDQYFNVKFDEESEFDSFGAEKWSRDLLSDPLRPLTAFWRNIWRN